MAKNQQQLAQLILTQVEALNQIAPGDLASVERTLNLIQEIVSDAEQLAKQVVEKEAA